MRTTFGSGSFGIVAAGLRRTACRVRRGSAAAARRRRPPESWRRSAAAASAAPPRPCRPPPRRPDGRQRPQAALPRLAPRPLRGLQGPRTAGPASSLGCARSARMKLVTSGCVMIGRAFEARLPSPRRPPAASSGKARRRTRRSSPTRGRAPRFRVSDERHVSRLDHFDRELVECPAAAELERLEAGVARGPSASIHRAPTRRRVCARATR